MTPRILISCLLFTVSALGQGREMTLDDVLLRTRALTPRPLVGLAWKDAGHFTYLKWEGPRPTAWVSQSVKDGTESVLVDAKEVAALAKSKGIKSLSLFALAGATWNDNGSSARLQHARALWKVTTSPLELKKQLELPDGIQGAAFSKDDTHVAYTRGFNVHVRNPDGTTHQVTHDGFEFLTHGMSVSRVEFGITDGLWWDPTGRRVAFYREDLRVIEPHPYIDWTSRPAALVNGRYPMAGRRGSVVRVGIYDTQSGDVTWLKTDPTVDEYLTNVTWGPKGRKIYVAHVNRAQDTNDLHVYNAASGEHLAHLFTEKDEQWVEPEEGPIFLPTAPDHFLWLSNRGGFRHFYLYNDKGHVLEQVTRGKWDCGAFRGFTPDGSGFLFTTTGPDPRQMHLYRATLGKGQTKSKIEFRGEKDVNVTWVHAPSKSITQGRGQHAVLPSPDGKHFLDSHSNAETPPAVDLLSPDGSVVRQVHASKNPLAGFKLGKAEFFETETADGQTMYGRIITPPDMDTSGRKYPALCYLYGGPHAQVVLDSWPMGVRELWLQYMAAHGFVVYSVDNRGSGNRGIEWTQSIHRNMAKVEIADQLKGLEHVLARGFVDPKRVGIHGWSYGGYMTLSMMTRAGDHFRAGIAGAPVSHWGFYETGYTERYMDTPKENPKGYENSAPGKYVDGIKGRLLVVHGTSDDTVVWQHTVDFVQKCIDAMVDIDYFVYPGQLHGFRGKHREHLYRKMTTFFERELK